MGTDADVATTVAVRVWYGGATAAKTAEHAPTALLGAAGGDGATVTDTVSVTQVYKVRAAGGAAAGASLTASTLGALGATAATALLFAAAVLLSRRRRHARELAEAQRTKDAFAAEPAHEEVCASRFALSCATAHCVCGAVAAGGREHGQRRACFRTG